MVQINCLLCTRSHTCSHHHHSHHKYVHDFGGVLYSAPQHPHWMIWIYWLSPYSWLVRALALNEFGSHRYNALIADPTDPTSGVLKRTGDVYLENMGMFTDSMWIFYGVIYIIAFIGVSLFVQMFALSRPPPEFGRGARRVPDTPTAEVLQRVGHLEEDFRMAKVQQQMLHEQQQQALLAQQHTAVRRHGQGHEDAMNKSDNNLEIKSTNSKENDDDDDDNNHNHNTHHPNTNPSPATTQQTQATHTRPPLSTLTELIPFTPVTLSFSNIYYTVKAQNADGKKVDKILLNNINGLAEPGQLNFLLGGSAAGKTTLLNVLSMRANMGVMQGKILFNGVALQKAQHQHITRYVEQFPSLWGFSSVEETLMHTAELRMDANIEYGKKKQVVEEIIDILGLTSVRHSIIGTAMLPGLSPSQLKLVSIGIELCAQPAIIFADEPTTGQSAREAALVVEALRRVAATGRTVIVTIHQPSAELFFLGDNLLLMVQGGHMIYNGPLGPRALHFLQYYQSIPGISPISTNINPASYLLVEASKSGPCGDAAVKHEMFDEDWAVDNVVLNPQVFGKDAVDTFFSCCVEDNMNTPDSPRVVSPAVRAAAVAAWSTLNKKQQWGLYLKYAFYTSPTSPWTSLQEQLKHVESIHDLSQTDSTTTSQQRNDHNNKNNNNINNNKNQDDDDDDDEQNKTATTLRQSLFKQFILLFCRHNQAYFRNPTALINRFAVLLIATLISGIIYLQIDITNTSTMLSFMSALIMATGTASMSMSNTSQPLYFLTKPVFYREMSSGYYSHKCLWSLSNFCNEACWVLLYSTLLLPLYGLVGVGGDVVSFFKYWLLMWLVMVLYMGAQQSSASIAPTQPQAALFAGLLSGIAIALNGIGSTYNTLRDVSGFHAFLFWVLPLGPLNNALLSFLYKDKTQLIDVLRRAADGTLSYVKVPLNVYAAEYFGYRYDWEWIYFAIIIAQLVVWQVVYNVALTFINHNKK